MTLQTLTLFSLLFVFQGHAKICTGFGPQTPRDISSKAGTNPVVFNLAPSYKKMNLCNIHFHKNAEHKGPEFSVKSPAGDGYKCNRQATQKQLTAVKASGCKNVSVGDTIELHWVHSSCTVAPGKGLGACLSKACANPQLRVETQIFLLVNDDSAAKMADFASGKKKQGYHQAKAIPKGTGVEFLGSTTGPSYNSEVCSPLQVTWSVRPSCQLLDINSLHKWCKNNPFEESKAHQVRQLVTDKRLLSEIQ